MVTVANSFFSELDELSDKEERILDAENREEDVDDDHDYSNSNPKLQIYANMEAKVEHVVVLGTNQGTKSEDDPEHILIILEECNALSEEIENNDHITEMVVSVRASSTIIEHACDRALSLDSAKKKVADFVERRMGCIASNLSAVVGSAVAANGGLAALAKMPSCNVLFLGAKNKSIGYIEQTEIFQAASPSLRTRASPLLASKATLAARVDSIRGDVSGSNGRTLREEIRKKIEKWQDPCPARQLKPLPVPGSEPRRKKKSGGRRLRKTKETYAVTEVRKLANRVQFGVPEASSLGDGFGDGYGMLWQGGSGSGKLRRPRVSVGQRNKLGARVCKKLKEKRYGCTTSGLTSSLAFIALKGIELTNPQPHQLGSGTQGTYFSQVGTFSKIRRT